MERAELKKVKTPTPGDKGVNVKSPYAVKKPNVGGKVISVTGDGSKSGTEGGLQSPKVKDLNSGNVNVTGSNKATKLKSVNGGFGKSKGEQAANTKSPIGKR